MTGSMRAKPTIDVTLLVPGLLGPGGVGVNDPDAARALVAGLDLDALDRLLARADHALEPAADSAVEALAFRAFGHETRPAAGDHADRGAARRRGPRDVHPAGVSGWNASTGEGRCGVIDRGT